MVQIVARFIVRPAYRDSFDRALADNIPQTRTEAGCVRFDAYTEEGRDEAIWLIETWTSEDALASHYEQPYARAILDQVDDWCVEPPRIVRCAPFENDDR